MRKPNVRHASELLAKLRLLTLKALANSSPGLRFGNPGEQRIPFLRRNSEGVASRVANKNRRNSEGVASRVANKNRRNSEGVASRVANKNRRNSEGVAS